MNEYGVAGRALTAALLEAVGIIICAHTNFTGLTLSLVPDARLLTIYFVFTATYNIILTYLLESYILGIAGTVLMLYYSGALSPPYYLASVIASILIAWRLRLGEILFTAKLSYEWRGSRLPDVMNGYTVYIATLSLGFMLAYIIVEALKPPLSIWYQWVALGLIAGLLLPLRGNRRIINLSAGLLTPLSYIGIAALSYLTLASLSITTVSETLGSDKGVLMGFIKAVLSSKKRRGRTIWYWRRVASRPLRIDFARLPNNHVVITGASGMGKSLLAKNIVLQLHILNGYGFLIIDPHGEYADLAETIPAVNIIDASTVSLNPLELEGQDPDHRAHELSYTIQSLFNLGHLQRQIIEDLIMEAYKSKGIYPDNPGSWGNKPPSFNDLLATAEAAAADNDLVRRIIPYLRVLSSRIFSSTSMGFSEIVSKPAIIQLNKLSSDYIRSLYIDTLLHKLIASMYKKKGKRLIVVIDEAHLVFRRSPGRRAVSKLLMESRKYGLGFIIISQQPLSLSDTVFQNTSIRISFNTGEPRNSEYAARLHALSGDKSKINAVKEAVSSLKPHEYLLSTINTRFPVIVDSKDLKTIIDGSLTTITGSENKRLTGS